jgi:glutathione S-transferase
MLRLLGRKTSSNVQKVLWLLAELDIPCERLDYGGHFGGNKDVPYLELNPNGLVPTLIDGDTVIWESNTILRYIANVFGPTSVYPADAAARALCERWMDWQLGTLSRPMAQLYITLVRAAPDQRDHQTVAALASRVGELFALVDGCLADSAFLAGDHLTLADIALGILAYRWFTLEVARGPDLPRLGAWYARLQERPAFRDHVMIGLS